MDFEWMKLAQILTKLHGQSFITRVYVVKNSIFRAFKSHSIKLDKLITNMYRDVWSYFAILSGKNPFLVILDGFLSLKMAK